jgi:hypothetical protein
MNKSGLSFVPLQQASLCLDCEMITSAQTHCFACGSVALMNLARTLNGNAAAGQLRGELFVVGKNSPRPKQPAAFTSIRPHQDPGFREKYADLRKAFSSVLVRPVRQA